MCMVSRHELAVSLLVALKPTKLLAFGSLKFISLILANSIFLKPPKFRRLAFEPDAMRRDENVAFCRSASCSKCNASGLQWHPAKGTCTSAF